MYHVSRLCLHHARNYNALHFNPLSYGRCGFWGQISASFYNFGGWFKKRGRMCFMHPPSFFIPLSILYLTLTNKLCLIPGSTYVVFLLFSFFIRWSRLYPSFEVLPIGSLDVYQALCKRFSFFSKRLVQSLHCLKIL